MVGRDLLARLDRLLVAQQRALAELAALRAELAAAGLPAAGTVSGDPLPAHTPVSSDDDLSPEHLLDTTSAAARFNYDRHTLARWCRTEGVGVRRGGRWLVSIPRLQRHLNGGG